MPQCTGHTLGTPWAQQIIYQKWFCTSSFWANGRALRSPFAQFLKWGPVRIRDHSGCPGMSEQDIPMSPGGEELLGWVCLSFLPCRGIVMPNSQLVGRTEQEHCLRLHWSPWDVATALGQPWLSPLPFPLGQPLRDVLPGEAHPQRLWEALGWGCCPSLLSFPKDPTMHSLRLSSRTAADPWGPSLLDQSLQPVLSKCDLGQTAPFPSYFPICGWKCWRHTCSTSPTSRHPGRMALALQRNRAFQLPLRTPLFSSVGLRVGEGSQC